MGRGGHSPRGAGGQRDGGHEYQFLGPSQHPLTMVPTLFTSILAIFVVPALFAALATIWAAARPGGERAHRGQPHPVI